MNIKVSLIENFNVHRFEALGCEAQNQDELKLDPIEFYFKYGSVPTGKNWELQILKPDQEFLDQHKLHVHKGKDGKTYVCYPLPIEHAKRAAEIFEIWCIGAVLKSIFNVDLNTIYSEECQNDDGRFKKIVHERFGIRTEYIIISPA